VEYDLGIVRIEALVSTSHTKKSSQLFLSFGYQELADSAKKDVEDGLQSCLTAPKGHQGRLAHATSADMVLQGPLNGTWFAMRWSNQMASP